MQTIIPYQPAMAQDRQSLSLKEAVGYTVLCGAAVAVSIYFVQKAITNYKAKHSDMKSFKQGSPETIAAEINMALHNGILPASTDKLRLIFLNLSSQQEYDRIAQEFLNQNHKVMENDMRDNMQDSEVDELLAIKSGKPLKDGQKVSGTDLYRSWSGRIKAALDYKYLRMFDAVSSEALSKVLNEIPTQRAFINVGVAYFKDFKSQLMPDLKAKLGGDYDNYLKLITNKPKA